MWSVGYEAAASSWLGTAMPLFDRANNVLAELQSAGIGDRPICWVTHSMGGLLVKQMLRNADSLAPEFRKASTASRCVIFIGTPHTGSDLVSLARYLGFILRISVAAKELQALGSPLLELNTWYRENHRRLGVATQVFFENQATRGVRVVDRGSADPGLEGVIPIGLDADHVSICKPSGRNDLIYKRTRAFIRDTLALRASHTVATEGDLEPADKPRFQWEVALSFASAQRDYVQQVSQALQAQGIRCFYDADEQIGLWGKYLSEELPAIYCEQAGAVVIFISADYAARDWTRHERRAALSRAVHERQEYVLPARFDDTRLPGLLSDMATIDLRNLSPQQFAVMITNKLAALGICSSSSTARATDPASDTESSGHVTQPGDGRPPPSAADLAGLSDEQIRMLREGIAALRHLMSCLADLRQTPRLSTDFVEISAQAISAADLATDQLHLLAQQVGGRTWPHKEWALRFCDAERNFRRNSKTGYVSYDNRFAGSAANLLRILETRYSGLPT